MTHDVGLNGAVVAVLREERAAAGLTLEEVAGRAGIPVVSVQRFLSARRRMTMDTFDALCGALGLDPVEVMGRAERRPDGPDAPSGRAD